MLEEDFDMTRTIVYRKSLTELIETHIPNPKLGAEVGVFEGHTTAYLLNKFHSLNMIAIDPWASRGQHATRKSFRFGVTRMELAKARFFENLAPFAPRFVTTEMEGVDGAKTIRDGELDFCFIDDDHRSWTVRANMEAYWPKVRSGGLFCGHDYGRPDDKRKYQDVKPTVDAYAKELGVEVGVMPGMVWWWRKP